MNSLERLEKKVNNMGKYQLDTKGKAAVTKYHEKNKPAQFDKKQQLEQLRAAYLERKQKQAEKE